MAERLTPDSAEFVRLLDRFFEKLDALEHAFDGLDLRSPPIAPRPPRGPARVLPITREPREEPRE